MQLSHFFQHRQINHLLTLLFLTLALGLLWTRTQAVSSSRSNVDVKIEAASADNQETSVNFTEKSLEISAFTAQSCATLPADIVSWWSGEGDAQDAVSGNHGTLQGGATFTSGKVGQGFSLDGVNDFISVPFNENYNFDPNEQFTIETWVKPQPNSSFQAIFSTFA